MTFFVVCEPETQHMDALLDIIYEVLANRRNPTLCGLFCLDPIEFKLVIKDINGDVWQVKFYTV
ncbi:hypothetical protein C5167_041775 [Papaver somniferum]|nr:hypothetical protein C5167_041775 [Papaver somniferum]